MRNIPYKYDNVDMCNTQAFTNKTWASYHVLDCNIVQYLIYINLRTRLCHLHLYLTSPYKLLDESYYKIIIKQNTLSIHV